MLFKKADDKLKRLQLLDELQASPVVDARQRAWLKEEYWRVRQGMEGERDAAFHMDSLLRDGPNTAVLHDLRLVLDDEVAQIDHLVFNRLMDFILVETKCYSGDVDINELGEFTVSYPSGRRHGVPSPLAQSERHARVLGKLLERLGITGRLGTQPRFHHVVMFHPKAVIRRPAASKFETRNVIKADQFAQWRERWLDEPSGLSALTGMLNLRGQDTLKEWAEMLMRQHRPADQLALPDFMQPRRPAAIRVPLTPPQRTEASSQRVLDQANEPPARRLLCATCGIKISFAEGKFCWNNGQRFGGLQYCRAHQAAFQSD